MDKRPEFTKSITVKDFNEFYWLKEELIEFCRTEELNSSDGKIVIAERIEHYLKTGQKKSPKKEIKPKSTFDWNSELLTLDTVITDNYKNSENVRTFFEQQIGNRFKFNVRFMNWMKSNSGKTLNDAINQYELIASNKPTKPSKNKIAPQFEYNAYLRDFLADNPDCSRDLGIKLWNIKRTLRGENIYSKDDFELLKKE